MSPTPNPSAPAQGTPTPDPTLGHTPLPWTYLSRRTLHHVESSIDAKVAGESVCSIPLKRKADAALIVRNVNGYAEAMAERDITLGVLGSLFAVREVKDAAFNFAVTDYHATCTILAGGAVPSALATLTAERDALKAERDAAIGRENDVRQILDTYVGVEERAEKAESERDRLREALEMVERYIPNVQKHPITDCWERHISDQELAQIRTALASTAPSETARLRESNAALVKSVEDLIDLWKRTCAPRNIEMDSQIKEARAALTSAKDTQP